MAGDSRRAQNEIARGASPPRKGDADRRRKERNRLERNKKSAALDITASPGIDRIDEKPK